MSALLPLPDKARLLERAHRARIKWGNSPRPEEIEVAASGEESVWDFPRPPLVRAAGAVLRVESNGLVVAETQRGLTVCETAGAPVHYFPSEDVRTDWLTATDHITICEWKGAGVHYDLTVGNRTVPRAAYCYPRSARRSESWLHPNRRLVRFLSRAGRLLRRRRAGAAAAGWLLRRLGDGWPARPDQGRAGHRGLVAAVHRSRV